MIETLWSTKADFVVLRLNMIWDPVKCIYKFNLIWQKISWNWHKFYLWQKFCLSIGTLVFALPQQNYGKPPLLNFNETKEVLRNFGKMLQHMLTENEYSESCGQASIEKDARGKKKKIIINKFFSFLSIYCSKKN